MPKLTKEEQDRLNEAIDGLTPEEREALAQRIKNAVPFDPAKPETDRRKKDRRKQTEPVKRDFFGRPVRK